MGIAHWPQSMQPREKLLTLGAKSLSDSELIAIFLRTGVKGVSALDLSVQMLEKNGGILGLLDLSCDEFCAVKGAGRVKYVQLQAALELACRYLWQQSKDLVALEGPSATRRFLKSQFARYRHEVFACIWLDSQHRILGFDEMFRGTIDGAAVYPREVVKEALRRNAAAIIIAHNHPSGVAEPSLADKSITEKLKQALALVDVRLLDHLVVGQEEVVSFVERGFL